MSEFRILCQNLQNLCQNLQIGDLPLVHLKGFSRSPFVAQPKLVTSYFTMAQRITALEQEVARLRQVVQLTAEAGVALAMARERLESLVVDSGHFSQQTVIDVRRDVENNLRYSDGVQQFINVWEERVAAIDRIEESEDSEDDSTEAPDTDAMSDGEE